MSQKNRRKKRRRQEQPSRRLAWLAIGGVVLALVAVGLWLLLRPQLEGRDVATDGKPRLVIDQTTVDEGYLRYDVPVRTTFRLSNAGDAPLKILGKPQVQLVQGC